MFKYKLTDEIIDKVRTLKRKKKGTTKYLARVLKCGLTKAKEVSKEIVANHGPEVLVDTPAYTYNAKDDKYIVYLKALGKNAVISGDLHRAILRAYSNWNGSSSSINEICRNFNLPKEVLLEYKEKMGWTHDIEPITDEEYGNKDNNELINDLLQRRKFSLYQRFQKETWKQTQDDAKKWQRFVSKQFNPFEESLKTWQVPPHLPVSYKGGETKTQVLVIGLSDLHIGCKSEREILFRHKEYNAEEAKKALQSYLEQIAAKAATGKYQSVTVCALGDLLDGLRGKTAKGTELEQDISREKQFDEALNLLTMFFDGLLALFKKVDIEVVRGNHCGLDNYILFQAISCFYSQQKRILIKNHKTRTAVFRIKDVLFVIDHGASEFYKTAVPAKGKERESYIQSLLLAHPDLLQGVKQKMFCQGDKHHTELIEYNDFEFFMFSSIARSQYSDHNNWSARPSQNGLVVAEDGIVEILRFYFDRKK